MKKFTSLLIGCSLALAGAALAQQPEEQQTPTNKKPQKTHQATPKPEQTVAKPEVTPAKQHGTKNQHDALKDQNAEMTPKSEKSGGTETNVSGEPGASATPGGKGEHGKHAIKEHATMEKTSGTPANMLPTSSVSPRNERNEFSRQANTEGKVKQQPAPEKVHEIKAEHANFHAQPKPDRAPAVTFNQNYRIEGSDRWQGPQYEVFRSYHPERHDHDWYRSHYHRVELIGGGYYYWNNGYWYPAWGYDPSAEYYAYDGPIYVGHTAEPPDQVVADVQSELQEMGYYEGEVDGLLGPLTRQALAAYQADQGLIQTAAIDEPTLDSLGFNS